MLKNQILFIIIILSAINLYSISASLGIKNGYLNDKITHKFTQKYKYKENNSNYDIYKIGANFNLKILSLYFESFVDYGFGNSNNTSLKNISKETEINNFDSKEIVLNYELKLKNLLHIGPLYFGPTIFYDYESQEIKNSVELIQKEKIKWYLPSIGIEIKIKPLAWKKWYLFTEYDYSLGIVKIDPFTEALKKLASRQQFILGSSFKIYKRLHSNINFVYKNYNDHFTSKIKRESFEGNLILSLNF